MTNLSTFAAVLCLSLAGGAATHLVLQRPAEERPEDLGAQEFEALRAELAQLREETRSALAALQQGLAAQALARKPVDPPRLETAAVQVEPAPGPASGAAPTAPEAFDVATALARLIDPSTGWDESEQLWKRAREAGRVEDLVKAFEARALAEPNNPQAHSELGEAYGQMAAVNGNSPEAATWAIKADRSYDKALELDQNHWEARFNKAISLSFWPPVFGKGGEAVRQFETLLSQQRTAPAAPEHAYTYYFLGNLYSQQGNQEKAREIWNQGALLFPGNKELAGQLKVGRQ